MPSCPASAKKQAAGCVGATAQAAVPPHAHKLAELTQADQLVTSQAINLKSSSFAETYLLGDDS